MTTISDKKDQYPNHLLHSALGNVLLEHDITSSIEHEFDVFRIRGTRIMHVDRAILVLLRFSLNKTLLVAEFSESTLRKNCRMKSEASSVLLPSGNVFMITLSTILN